MLRPRRPVRRHLQWRLCPRRVKQTPRLTERLEGHRANDGGGDSAAYVGADEHSHGGVRGSGMIRATGGPGDGARGRPDRGGHGRRVPEHHGVGGED